jgi:two-component system chemotaxis response regulator CheB
MNGPLRRRPVPNGVVVLGASAGGVEALREIVSRLPSDLDAAVLVVLHIPRNAPSALPRILARHGPLPASSATDGEALQAARIYVAPADRHLLVSDGRVRLSPGPAENGHRPAIDPLFRSAARWYDGRVIAAVLSGSRDDGTSGLAAVVDRGGLALVQDPDDALHPSMPRSAMEHVPSARAYPAGKLADAIAGAVGALPAASVGSTRPDDLLAMETAVAGMADLTTDELGGVPAGLACPACHGALFELPGEPSPRYRCRVGHAWSPDSLLDEQSEVLESAIWMALRTLEEKAALSSRLADSSRSRGNSYSAGRYDRATVEARKAADAIRTLLPRMGEATENPDRP